MFRTAFIVSLALAFTPTAFAQEGDTPEWSGEGAFSAGYTTGNTETRDLGAALKLKHAGARWIQSGEAAVDFGETDGVETKNRIAASGQVDRIISARWSGYGRLTWEKDEFSGFENRYFFGLGAAFKAVDTPATQWTLEGGPGYKIDEVRLTGETEDSVSARIGSRVSHAFNDNVSLSNDTEIVYAQTSTQMSNITALTANLMGNLSARISFDIRHDTGPLPGFEATDTATKVSLVYKIG